AARPRRDGGARTGRVSGLAPAHPRGFRELPEKDPARLAAGTSLLARHGCPGFTASLGQSRTRDGRGKTSRRDRTARAGRGHGADAATRGAAPSRDHAYGGARTAVRSKSAPGRDAAADARPAAEHRRRDARTRIYAS